jgi:hypothetical protein
VSKIIAEDLVEGRRVAGVLVGGDLVRRRSGDRHGRAEERLGSFLIAGFAQLEHYPTKLDRQNRDSQRETDERVCFQA